MLSIKLIAPVVKSIMSIALLSLAFGCITESAHAKGSGPGLVIPLPIEISGDVESLKANGLTAGKIEAAIERAWSGYTSGGVRVQVDAVVRVVPGDHQASPGWFQVRVLSPEKFEKFMMTIARKDYSVDINDIRKQIDSYSRVRVHESGFRRTGGTNVGRALHINDRPHTKDKPSDAKERWVPYGPHRHGIDIAIKPESTPTAPGFLKILAHEVGHVLGRKHQGSSAPDGAPKDLMKQGIGKGEKDVPIFHFDEIYNAYEYKKHWKELNWDKDADKFWEGEVADVPAPRGIREIDTRANDPDTFEPIGERKKPSNTSRESRSSESESKILVIYLPVEVVGDSAALSKRGVTPERIQRVLEETWSGYSGGTTVTVQVDVKTRDPSGPSTPGYFQLAIVRPDELKHHVEGLSPRDVYKISRGGGYNIGRYTVEEEYGNRPHEKQEYLPPYAPLGGGRADIYINRNLVERDPDKVDSVVAHEVGHVLGFPHTESSAAATSKTGVERVFSPQKPVGPLDIMDEHRGHDVIDVPQFHYNEFVNHTERNGGRFWVNNPGNSASNTPEGGFSVIEIDPWPASMTDPPNQDMPIPNMGVTNNQPDDAGVDGGEGTLNRSNMMETQPEVESDQPETEHEETRDPTDPQPIDPEPTTEEPGAPDYRVMGDPDNPPQVAEVPEDMHSCLAFSCDSGGSLEDGIGWNVDWDGLPEWREELEAGGDLSCQATCVAQYGYAEGSELVDDGSASVSDWQTQVTTQEDIDLMSGAAFSPNPTDTVNSSHFHENMSFIDFDKRTKVEFEQSPGAGGTVSITDQSGTQVTKELPENWREASTTAPDGTTYSFERGVDTPNTSWTVEKPDGTVQTGGGQQIQDTPQQNYSIESSSPVNQSTSTQSAEGTGMPTSTSINSQTDHSYAQPSTTNSGRSTSNYGTDPSQSQGSTGTVGPPSDRSTSQKGASGSGGGGISSGTPSEYSNPQPYKDVGARQTPIAPSKPESPPPVLTLSN